MYMEPEKQISALVFGAAQMKHIDILFLQEIHSDKCNKADWDKD